MSEFSAYIFLFGTLMAFYGFSILCAALYNFVVQKQPIAEAFAETCGFSGERRYALLVACLAFLVLIFWDSRLFSPNSESLKYRDDGVYCYTVKAEKNGKTYTLPAKIRVETVDVDYTSRDGESRTRITTYYSIENLYFSNGGYIWFNEPELLTFSAIEKGAPVWQREYDSDSTWSLTIIDAPNYTDQFEESPKHATVEDYATFIFFLASYGALVYAVFCRYSKREILTK